MLDQDNFYLLSYISSLSVFFTPVGEPFNSHELPRQNFSLQYQNNIKQTSDENKEKYQLGDYKLI